MNGFAWSSQDDQAAEWDSHRFILAVHPSYRVYIPNIDLYSIMGQGIYWADSIACWCLRIDR